jgi:hypothetical protein
VQDFNSSHAIKPAELRTNHEFPHFFKKVREIFPGRSLGVPD